MFIARSAPPKDLAPLGAKPGSGTIAEAKAIALLTELKSKERPPNYKHLAPMGRSDKQYSVALPS